MRLSPMTRWLLFVGAAALACVAPGCRTQAPPAAPPRALAPPPTCADWVPLTFADGAIRASLPAPPRRETEILHTVVGECEIIRYRAGTQQADYDAGWLARPRGLLASLAGPDRILREACEGTATRLGGRIRTSSPLTVDGHPARDVRIIIAGQTPGDADDAAARLILLPDRIAHAIVVAHEAPLDPDATTWFLSSLRPSATAASVTEGPAPDDSAPGLRTH